MLVMSRKKSEIICIGETIRITVVKIGKDKVRIGVDAPRDVAVHRKEIYDAMNAEIESTDSDSD